MKMVSATGGNYKMVYARQLFTTQTTKTLDEARGYVVADYQNFLEEQWNKKMRAEYPVKVNESVFNSMVKVKTGRKAVNNRNVNEEDADQDDDSSMYKEKTSKGSSKKHK